MKYARKIPLFAFLLTLWVSFPVVAEVKSTYQTCVACHGDAGQGNAALQAPALAGQDAAYLERQLRNFKTGVRGGDATDSLGTQMRGMALVLGDEDVAVVAAWLSELPPPSGVTPQAGDVKNGNNYYQANCGACHGGKAQGNPGLHSPALAWLDSAYLKRQFVNFQQGLRGAHPDDKYGRQMQMMSTTLPTDKDLDDVIAFINTLAPQP